jgi:retron-type reverse transcriptase
MIEQVLRRENMEQAWAAVRANKGGPGVDGVTLARWERNLESNLSRLSEQVRTNTYHPNRPKRFWVARKDGGWRELSRLTVADKVLQRAVLNVLEAPFEARFLNCSHGYRPNRSTATAIQQVLGYRDRGLGWVLDADITACFDSLDHELLMGLLRRVVDDWHILNLTALWLKAGTGRKSQIPKAQKPKGQTPTVEEGGEKPPTPKSPSAKVGVPMGGVLSPLWCNVYLHQLDARLTSAGWRLIRYADDFVVLTGSEAGAHEARAATERALADLRLTLSERKTQVTSFEAGFDFLGVRFYRDTYSYDWEGKRVEVKGRNIRWLYRHGPQFY